MVRIRKPAPGLGPSQQRGQAIIEYAIILILLVTLVLGGAELGIAAYSSSKVSEAAKAGAAEYTELNVPQNEQTAELTAELKADLLDLESQRRTLELQKSGLEAELDILERHLALLQSQGTPSSEIEAKIADKQAEIGIPATDDPPAPSTGIYALIDAKQAEIDAKQIAINTPPPLLWKLGNHDPASNINGINMPACLPGNEYTDGLPDRYVDPAKYPNYADGTDGDTTDNDKVFLFNPLPIDIASCEGQFDTLRGNRSRLSILINGYVDPDAPESTYYPGLPKLNQALYSQYTKACIADGVYFDCGQPGAPAPVLKPPGKLCLSDIGEGCPTIINDPFAPIAGYYFFGSSIDDSMTIAEASETFRPTFQITCGDGSSYQSNQIMVNCPDPDDISQPYVQPEKIAVHARYRAIFESSLTFGLYKLPDNSLLPYFYNPGGVNADGGRIIAAVGGEIGTASKEDGVLRNTVKKFRDFRGCYSVNTTTNQVSACN